MARLPLEHPESYRVRELRCADCDQLSDLITGGDTEFIQLGAGLCHASMTRVDLDGFYLLLTDMPNRTTGHAFWDALDGHMLADTPAARRFIEAMEWVFALAAHAPERFGFPEIRTSLRQGSREAVSVSSCAQEVGFPHRGRFSSDYRKMFGESPSQTLDRSL